MGENTGADVAEPIDIEDKLLYPVRPIKQERVWDCGPTALRIALRYQFGLKLTASEMIMVTGATPAGSDEYNLMLGLDALGFKYKQSEHGTLNKLKRFLMDGQVPIVHLVLTDGGGHYMILCGYDVDNVYLADPSTNKIVKYGIPFFMGVWKIEEKESQTRWYMAITGHGGDKLDGILQRYKRLQKKVQKARK